METDLLLYEIENQYLNQDYEASVFYNLVAVAHSNVTDIRLKFIEEKVYGETGEPILSSLFLNVALAAFPIHSIIANTALNLIKRSKLITEVARKSLVKIAKSGTDVIPFVNDWESKIFKHGVGEPIDVVVKSSIEYFYNYKNNQNKILFVPSIRESSFMWWQARRRAILTSYLKSKKDILQGNDISKIADYVKSNPVSNGSKLSHDFNDYTIIIRLFEIIILAKSKVLEATFVYEKKSYARWWDDEAGGTYISVAKNKKSFADYLATRYGPVIFYFLKKDVRIFIEKSFGDKANNEAYNILSTMFKIDRTKFRSDNAYWIRVFMDLAHSFRTFEIDLSNKINEWMR